MAAGAVAVAGNGAMPHPQVVGVAGASRTAITVEEAENLVHGRVAHEAASSCEPEPPQAMHRLYGRHAWLC